MLLLAAAIVLWGDPGNVAAVDFSLAARGAAPPSRPFTFLKEDTSGTSAKVLIRDAAGIVWQVKGGPEARAESFATRLVAALGFYADSVLFISKGHLNGVPTDLGRASGFIHPDGTFTWASFERRDPDGKFLGDKGWKWTDLHTPEAHGLRILVMLVSNWDNKDARNFLMGSNTGFIEKPDGIRAYITDWGQSLGSWGRLIGRSNWNCEAFKRQTPTFVQGVRNRRVRFGYTGQHTYGFADDISLDDVRWLMTYLGQITDAQLRTGLGASGATVQEQECFTQSLRARIETLRRLAALR